ncbi:DUF2306 domain-containing protein [Nonomuraea zeae]|uniref:DUF2306 domain-containing protein n=1 Tax=Nonomuraea zeae TaxID=1642303 RepID=A0A5S4GWJ0_9ACTN|nr:DUF2306 domain-containing protein [Nonomuraea zeae]TMR37333.1 DUF2306 domain-containing protein [Nonomuraea zeae]
MDEIDIGGIPVPDRGPLFLTVLAIHVAAGLTCATCGAAAALSRKGAARHRRFGRIYLWALGVVFASMSVMSVIRRNHNAHLFVIGAAAFALAMVGYLSRRRRPYLHIAGLGGSYAALLTGFYVDKGPHLPGRDRLPAWTYWVLPSLIGLPVIARAIGRRQPAEGVTSC